MSLELETNVFTINMDEDLEIIYFKNVFSMNTNSYLSEDTLDHLFKKLTKEEIENLPDLDSEALNLLFNNLICR